MKIIIESGRIAKKVPTRSQAFSRVLVHQLSAGEIQGA